MASQGIEFIDCCPDDELKSDCCTFCSFEAPLKSDPRRMKLAGSERYGNSTKCFDDLVMQIGIYGVGMRNMDVSESTM